MSIFELGGQNIQRIGKKGERDENKLRVRASLAIVGGCAACPAQDARAKGVVCRRVGKAGASVAVCSNCGKRVGDFGGKT